MQKHISFWHFCHHDDTTRHACTLFYKQILCFFFFCDDGFVHKLFKLRTLIVGENEASLLTMFLVQSFLKAFNFKCLFARLQQWGEIMGLSITINRVNAIQMNSTLLCFVCHFDLLPNHHHCMLRVFLPLSCYTTLGSLYPSSTSTHV